MNIIQLLEIVKNTTVGTNFEVQVYDPEKGEWKEITSIVVLPKQRAVRIYSGDWESNNESDIE